jgi:predicted  nucleic acid-binding Zn-ribbon protein
VLSEAFIWWPVADVHRGDMTAQGYDKRLDTLYSDHETTLQDLKAITADLVPKSMERARLQEDDPDWSRDSQTKAYNLSHDIQTMLKDMSTLESTLKRLQVKIKALEHDRDFISSERESLLEAT